MFAETSEICIWKVKAAAKHSCPLFSGLSVVVLTIGTIDALAKDVHANVNASIGKLHVSPASIKANRYLALQALVEGRDVYARIGQSITGSRQ